MDNKIARAELAIKCLEMTLFKPKKVRYTLMIHPFSLWVNLLPDE